MRILAATVSIALAVVANGCGGSNSGQGDGRLLTTSDVRKAFAREGLSLVVGKDKAPWVHFLWYGGDGGNGERLAFWVFDEPAGAADARIAVKGATRWAGRPKIFVARNVVVFVLSAATPDDRRRASSAVETLKRS